MTVRGVSQNVIATSGEASVTSQEFGGEVVSVTINTYEAGKQPWYDSWQQPISWSDMRKYFDPVFGVDARRLIDDLESNVQSLEDYLDTAFIKTYGGVAQGVIKFLQGIQVSGPYGLGYISFVGSTGSAIDYTGLMNITGITTGSSNYLTLNSEGMIIKSNRSGVDPYITFVDYPSISGDSATLTRKGTGSAARLELDNNLTISARNPVLRIEETGTTDNVDLELMQTGSSAEGLRLRYESGTGHSRITNIYSAGNLYLNTNNNTANAVTINPTGNVMFNNQPYYAGVNGGGNVATFGIYIPSFTVHNFNVKFNTGNGRFTPGFDCRVQCTFASLVDKPNTNSYAWCVFYKNGNEYGNRIHTHFGSYGFYEPLNHTMTIPVTSSDYIEFGFYSVNGASIYGSPWGGGLTFTCLF